MPAGRPPKPTAMKRIEGTYRQDRALPQEVEPRRLAAVPDPPENLTDMARREWYVVCDWLLEVGNLAFTDISLVAAYCNEMSLYWEYDKKLKAKGETIVYKNQLGEVLRVQVNPYVSMRKSALDSALRLAGQFGFTPSARTRIKSGNQTDKADPLQDLLDQIT